MNNFNTLSRELISDISILIHDIDDGNIVDKKLKDKIRAKITELQWRAIELDIIFANDKSENAIDDYKVALNELGTSVENAKRKEDTDRIGLAVIKFTNSSVKVIDALARKAGLKISPS